MSEKSSRAVGVGRVLIAVYGILALAATGRSLYQLLGKFDEAPLAYGLSALAAVVYILATVAFIGKGVLWWRIAVAAVIFELVGVLLVGTASLVLPELFAHDSVWSYFGRGYGFIPLLLPLAGLFWLWQRSPARLAEQEAEEAAAAAAPKPLDSEY